MDKGPTFLVIGAAKCGTTSLYNYLKKHRDIFFPTIKEIHYFDDCAEFKGPKKHTPINIDKYLDWFKASKSIHAGEVTPMYCFKKIAMERI